MPTGRSPTLRGCLTDIVMQINSINALSLSYPWQTLQLALIWPGIEEQIVTRVSIRGLVWTSLKGVVMQISCSLEFYVSMVTRSPAALAGKPEKHAS